MNPQDPLADLQPLREPPLVHWWPPAPGWWILAVLLLVACGTAAFFYRRHRQRNAYRRAALKQLQVLQDNPDALADDAAFAAELNALLKSTALAAYTPAQVAGRHGEAWRAFLNQSLAHSDQFEPAFVEAGYRPGTQAVARDRALHSASQWIRKHRVAQ